MNKWYRKTGVKAIVPYCGDSQRCNADNESVVSYESCRKHRSAVLMDDEPTAI